jgi:hypothetical protein
MLAFDVISTMELKRCNLAVTWSKRCRRADPNNPVLYFSSSPILFAAHYLFFLNPYWSDQKTISIHVAHMLCPGRDAKRREFWWPP